MLYQIFDNHSLFLLIHRTKSYSLLQDLLLSIHINLDMSTEERYLISRLAIQGLAILTESVARLG